MTHLQTITDQFGIWQHHENGKILSDEGYALDDSARGLIVYILYGDLIHAEICLEYVDKSIKDHQLVGFFHADKTIRKFPSSDDAFGLAFWALAYCINNNIFADKAKKILAKIDTSKIINSSFIRTMSYSIIALSLLHEKEQADTLVAKIIKSFQTDKNWFEDTLTYANAIIPYALLVYSEEFKVDSNEMDQIVKQSIDTLEKYCRLGKIPAPIGNREWHTIGKISRDPYGQQPIDAAFMVLLLVKAYNLYKEEKYKTAAAQWYDWFFGNNIMQQSLINNEDACADGIDESGISTNYGAESTIVFLWAAHEFNQI